jgi:hypothetical protein
MPDDNDDDIGREVIGSLMREVLAAGGTTVRDFQIRPKHAA